MTSASTNTPAASAHIPLSNQRQARLAAGRGIARALIDGTSFALQIPTRAYVHTIALKTGRSNSCGQTYYDNATLCTCTLVLMCPHFIPLRLNNTTQLMVSKARRALIPLQLRVCTYLISSWGGASRELLIQSMYNLHANPNLHVLLPHIWSATPTSCALTSHVVEGASLECYCYPRSSH